MLDRSAFAELVTAAGLGKRRRVLFLVPPNNKCAGPLYEIVRMHMLTGSKAAADRVPRSSAPICADLLVAFPPYIASTPFPGLRITGDRARPVEVRPDAGDDYRVGSSKAWRAGKRMLGMSVPWRFSSGRPFHAGLFWNGMEVGLKGLAKVLAR
ncbi:MAG TPA: hypothetical protein VHJ54_05265 [Solirubrobacterales bacterium]|nr:hypothetical protein [Solirubrobacterales bacterium]